MTLPNRRNFLRLSGLSIIPAILPIPELQASNQTYSMLPADETVVKFYGDGESYEPGPYLNLLNQINAKQSIERDRYGEGGAVEALEKKMEAITGKEKAVFMPSGTMANQLAIDVLSGNNTKVFVQDLSHLYRDEADAAQSVFGKRLMPLAKGEPYFTAAALKKAIDSLSEEEVFKSGIGAVSIENPVRRADGKMVPIEEIKKISEYCRANNIKLHMDGARVFLASAWSGVSVKEYASYFDTFYISLYKYFGAAAGAILCGDTTTMQKIPHLVKIHGGSMYSNWPNASMALHRMEGFEERLKNAIIQSKEIFSALNQMGSIKINSLNDGTNIYELQLVNGIDGTKLQTLLREKYQVRIPRPDKNGKAFIMVNETILYRDSAYIIDAFTKSITK